MTSKRIYRDADLVPIAPSIKGVSDYEKFFAKFNRTAPGKTYRAACMMASALQTAQNMASIDAGKIKKDEGTCVLGAGIAVRYLGKGRREAVDRIVVVSGKFQGNLSQYAACKRALEWLVENGIDAFWCDGRMD